MKLIQRLGLIAILGLLTSCFGDKKMTDVEEIGDTSFVNKNFNSNRINYNKDNSACEQMSLSTLANLYEVTLNTIHVVDNKNSDRFRKDIEPQCSFYIETSENDYEWLRGSMSLYREIGKDEMMGEIAEAAGGGENWKEAWALQKSISKSSEWVDNIGLAALWNDSKTELKIKFIGYTLTVYPPKNSANKMEVAKNRDYKSIALAMAKGAGYIN